MLYDRCMMAKRGDDWIGFVELNIRDGERYRSAAWVAAFIFAFEAFRLALSGFWYFNWWEALIMLVSAMVMIVLFKKSSKKFRYLSERIRIPRPQKIYDDNGDVVATKRSVILPGEKGPVIYDVERFTHIVFGVIDYPWPARRDVYIDASALYLAEADGTPHAIVEGAFDRASCFALARRISSLTRLPIIELGKGQPFVRDKR